MLSLCYLFLGRPPGGYDVPEAVLKVVQRHGSTRYAALAYEMGFSQDQIDAATNHRVAFADKLQAVFDAKAKSSGRYGAAKDLLKACRNVVDPFHGIVRDDLLTGKRHLPNSRTGGMRNIWLEFSIHSYST